MIKKNFTSLRLLQKFSVVLLLVASGFNVSYGQAACACKQSFQVSLDGNGNAVVTADMILTDPATCAGASNATVAVMLTPTGSPIAGSPAVNCSHVGKTLYGKISNGGNSCWSVINVEDKIAPVFNCPTTPITVNCFDEENFKPDNYVSDNCGTWTYNTTGNSLTVNTPGCPLGQNVLKRYVRTYEAMDPSGNVSAPCVVTIDVVRVSDLALIMKPTDRTIVNLNPLQCNDNYAKIPPGQPYAGNPSPVAINGAYGTGVPTLNGLPLYPDPNTHCNIMLSFTDVKMPVIHCVTKIIRTWQIIEWSCDNRIIPPLTPQMIEIVDNEGPEITKPADLTVTTSNHACTANVVFPMPVVSDNCSALSEIKIDIAYPGGFIKHGQTNFAKLPVGVHTITYTAYDACHNPSTMSFTLTVEDNTAPVAICDEFTTVALTVDGEAWVPAVVFDDGSYDECGLAKMLVRRMNNSNCLPCETPEFPGFTLLGEAGTGNAKRYYYLSNHAATPKVALKTALAMGGYGVSYETPEERTQVRNWVKAHNPNLDFLIGYTDLKKEGTYVWESGATNSMSVTGNVEDKDYVIVDADAVPANDGKLLAVDGSAEYRYVVEITDPCSWSAYTQFCCADIGANRMVAFRVIDKAGNWNDCMVSVIVQDKIPPSITCPPHMTKNCDFAFDANDLSASFGNAQGFDNCENPVVTHVADLSGFTECRLGQIKRTFTVTDAGSRTATCTQTITFENGAKYNGPSELEWPANKEMFGCDDPNDAIYSVDSLGRPVLNGNACSLVGSDYVDQIFRFNNVSDTSCFKILRHWTVIDWCQKEYKNGGWEYKKWTRTQVIKVNNKVAPTITLASDTVIFSFKTCEVGPINLSANGSDDCTDILKWYYKIDALNDGIADVGLTGNGVGNTAQVTGTYPFGTHRITWSFEDKCGNLTSKDQIFRVLDDKKPSPVCQPLSTALMNDPDGEGPAIPMVELWAVDFGSKSYKSCNANEVLLFTFNDTPMQVSDKTVFGQVINVNVKHYFDKSGGLLKWQSTPYAEGSLQKAIVDKYNRGEENTPGNGRIQLWDPALKSAAIVWSSNDLGPNYAENTVEVIMSVWDEGFRTDFCSTSLKLRCNNCSESGRRVSVQGILSTEMDEDVQNVHVRLVGSEFHTLTNAEGLYAFDNMPSGGSYAVRPAKDDDPKNGISTLDLVMIQRHILDLQKLDSPFKLIAADVNKDARISASDLVELRKLVLGTQDKFTNNTSWRFVDKNYTFADPQYAHTEAFPEIYDINLLNDDMRIDFRAVKTGDVNCSAQAGLNRNQVETRSSERLMLTTENLTFKKGQVVRIPVQISEEIELAGMQFTLSFNSEMFRLVSVTGEQIVISDRNLGFAGLQDGLITFSWNTEDAFKFDNKKALMIVEMEVLREGSLAENLTLNSAITKAEAYSRDLNIVDIDFRMNNRPSNFANTFNLYQNIPNPFTASTVIGFDLPEELNAMLEVYDINGRLMISRSIDGKKGNNIIELRKSELINSGVLYYTLRAGTYLATKKMVILD